MCVRVMGIVQNQRNVSQGAVAVHAFSLKGVHVYKQKPELH